MSIVLSSSLINLKLTSKQLKQINAEFPDSSLDEAVNLMLRNSPEKRKKRGTEKGRKVLFFNRRRSDFVNAHKMYEQEKANLAHKNLTPTEYEKAVKQLAQDLGI